MLWTDWKLKTAGAAVKIRVPQVSRLCGMGRCIIAAEDRRFRLLRRPSCRQSSAAARPDPARPHPSRFVVVLDAAHGGDDTGGRLDQRPDRKKPSPSPSASACARCSPPAASRSSPPANPTPPSTPTAAPRSPTTPTPRPASACTPPRAAPASTSLSLRWRPLQPARFPPGRPRRPPGSRAAWPSPVCSTPPCCMPA